MFFYLFPIGLSMEDRRRGIFTWVIVGLILYRFILGLFFKEIQVQIIASVPPVGNWSPDFLAMILQSLFTPVLLPGINPDEHIFFICTGVGATLLFWAGFGAGIETLLGRAGFMTLYLFGALAGLMFAWFDERFAMTGVFWLGHAATVAAIGASYTLFFAHDIRVLYFAWFFWGGGGGGVWAMPSMFLLVPAHFLVMVPQSMIWYGSERSLGLAVHEDGLTPLTWNLLLTVSGAGFAFLWMETRKFLDRPKKTQTESDIEITG